MKRFLFSILALVACVVASAQTIKVGYVGDDDQLMSIPYDGYKSVCSHVDDDYVKKYAGNQVVGLRIAVGSTAISDMVAYISADPNPNKPSSFLSSVSVTELTDGWNDVMFDQPYTLLGTEPELFVGYTLSSSTELRPVLVGTSTHNWGLLVFTNAENGTGWYDYSETGDLAVQLIIAGDKLPDYDIALTSLSTDKRYYPANAEKMYMEAVMENIGTKAIQGVTLSLMFDNNPQLGGDMQIAEEISGIMQLPFELPLSTYQLAPGKHTLTLSVKELGGGAQASAGTTADDAISYTFYIYDNALARTNSIMEFYVSASDDINNSLFVEPVEEFLSKNPNVIPVFIHGSFGEDVSDPLALSTATRLASAAGVKSVPTFGINRSTVPGSKTYLYDIYSVPMAESFAELNEYLQYVAPSFANITLNGSYNTANRLLTLDVQGTCNADFHNIFGNGYLTIYLTEDNVDGHNHVLRKIMTAPLGNEISWNGADGLSFQQTKRLTLDREWVSDNMHAIAFIHKATTETTSRDEMEITDVAVYHLNGQNVGISTVDMKRTPAVSYDLTGRRVTTTSPRKGLYITNGSKVLVNK